MNRLDMNFKKKRDETNELFKHDKILPFDKNLHLQSVKLLWKPNNNLLPTPLHSLFTKRPNSSSFYLPFRRLDITQRCPSYQGVYLWNETPRKIVLSPSVNSLKANLKDHLLNQL